MPTQAFLYTGESVAAAGKEALGSCLRRNDETGAQTKSAATVTRSRLTERNVDRAQAGLATSSRST